MCFLASHQNNLLFDITEKKNFLVKPSINTVSIISHLPAYLSLYG